MIDINEVKFDKDGLVPAIVVDFYTREVLTLAYMNRESLEITMKEGRTCFFSRSRQKLWRKGEESGNIQHVMEIKADCDRDALVLVVKKEGPACHLGTESCFNDVLFDAENFSDFTLDSLVKLIEGRKTSPQEGSYTTYLFEKGIYSKKSERSLRK